MPNAARLSPGDHVGRYVVLGMVGAGGMSLVYLAHDPELDRKVALKLMRVRIGSGGARRLQREAQALAKLSHPNVVPVYDVGMFGDQAFVAMEYVEGTTLRAWAKERHPWREVLRVMVDAGKGLAAAHARGLIHRDFKPDNVLLGVDGRVRVLDFGLARLAGLLDDTDLGLSPPSPAASPDLAKDSSPLATITHAGQIIGTPAYMAPEQQRGEPADARTDLFAFGVTLYEALFGTRPFDSANTDAVGSAARTTMSATSDLLVPRSPPRNTGVPRYVRKAVLRALAFEPAKRWQSVEVMLTALQRDPYRPWRRRGVWGAALAGAVAATLGLVHLQGRGQSACTGAATRMHGVWSDSTREAVRAAFARTGLSYANSAAVGVSRGLDAYVGRLAADGDAACAATRLRGEQSEEVMDLRMVCYRDREREVTAVVDLLSHADRDTVEQASRSVASLSPIADCADVATLRATSPKPRDPSTAARVDQIERRLALLKASRDVGKSAEAAANGDGLRQEANGLPFLPLLARIDFWRGRAHADRLETSQSTPAYQDAFVEALSSHEDRVLKDAALYLAQDCVLSRDQRAFDTWAAVAQGAIERGGADAEAQSLLEFTRCRAFYIAGKPISRLACLEKYADKVERTRLLDDRELNAMGAAASDAGEAAKGLAYTRRAYESSLRINGDFHPRTLLMRAYLCRALHYYGEPAESVRECGVILKAIEQNAGDSPYLLGRTRVYLAEALIDAKQFDDARAALVSVRGLSAGAFGDLGLAQDIESAEAEIDANTGHLERALPHYRSALSVALKNASSPSDDPDVLQSKLDLGSALLIHGEAVEARGLLEEALASAAKAEVGPTMRADIEFAAARASWAADAGAHERAMDLARRARDAYAEDAPRTRVFAAARAKIEDWLAHPR